MASPINGSISFLVYAFLVSFSLTICSPNKGFALGGGETLNTNYDYHMVKISSLMPSSVCSPSTKDQSKRGSLKVVHRHGPCSHINQDQASAPTTQILSHDQSRVASIHQRLGSKKAQNRTRGSRATLPANTIHDFGKFYVTVELGTPKKDLSLIIDTASSLSWTQCEPCIKCYNQKETIFNPSASESYRNITCDAPQCSQLTSAAGVSTDCSTATCAYDIQDGGDIEGDSSSVGFLGYEKLTITPSDVFPNFIFGCGRNNQNPFNAAAGLLGLSRDPLSAVSQTASKYGNYFSYCLPTPTSTGTLTFGKRGTTSKNIKFTPSPVNPKAPSFYFVDLIGIKVGGRRLPVSESVFKTPGTIIDTGTVITRLPSAAYAALRTSFLEATKGSGYRNGGFSFLDTCYDYNMFDAVKIPTISFLFSGNIEVPISEVGILYFHNLAKACLAFAGNSDASDVSILGTLHQETLDVVYDIAGEKIGFGTGGCS
ncbi:aspartyl protease family protein At5g10770-like [Rhododendron vialii]|uniref:aspartyl protease family protein At5g10770-like n=1 Tax=Rhododendron vialii TaxID=182163 RepID=UPI00265E95DF|nr:aspartyl protease family protein At5g10770-like [Rhododendron vialii]